MLGDEFSASECLKNIKLAETKAMPKYDVFEHLNNHTADVGAVNRLFGLLNKDDYDVVPTSLIFNPVDLKFASLVVAAMLEKYAPIDKYIILTGLHREFV